jgi:hypothetical protein
VKCCCKVLNCVAHDIRNVAAVTEKGTTEIPWQAAAFTLFVVVPINLLELIRAINLKVPFGRNVRISVRLCLQLEGRRR